VRKKNRNDYNHGKDGWVGGNPRYGRKRGFRKSDQPKDKAGWRKEVTRASD
jgi:hypothetical protein